MLKTPKLTTIGSTEYVDIDNIYFDVPAKVDTGADTSSIWASDIKVDKDGNLSFKLFDKQSLFYNGKEYHVDSGEYKVTFLRTSTGEEHVRYSVKLPIKLGRRIVKATFTLADRSKNSIPILIGRRTLTGKFIVDVSKNSTKRRVSKNRSKALTKELQENPIKFHQKYFRKEK